MEVKIKIMKIDKLYTLSQFIEHLYTNDTSRAVNLEERKADYFDRIVNYMQFLQQPLKKEMFVNEIEKPNIDDEKYMYSEHDNTFCDNDWMNDDLKAWQEAEKKVIIYSDKVVEGNITDNLDVYIGKYIITFYDDGQISLSIDECQYVFIETLNDLSRLTNGELKLKNVEI